MARCTVCNKSFFGGFRDGEKRFCSIRCFTHSDKLDFCEQCRLQTMERSPGSTHTVNGIGTLFIGAKERCPHCHSVVRRKWFLFLVPLIPMERYRIIHVDHARYIGRKLK